MAFDGITMACVVQELNEKLLDGRVYKIAQPEKDEILLTIKAGGTQQRLSLNADASLPLIYLTQENKKSPMTAPNFCMLLRKHIQNGRIVKIDQPGLERVVRFEIEHLDEMGDLRRKTLAMELMGKHSNIIFYDEENKILDSIKHISGLVSSVREVLPGRTYFIPQTEHKKDALIDSVNKGNFLTDLKETSVAVYKGIYSRYTGVSPIVAQEICYRAGKRLRHGHGELIPADGVGPFRAQQRQLQRLHAVGLADEAGDRVQNRERPRAGKARRVAQHEHRAVAVGLLLRVVAGDGGLLRARDEREAQLRLRAVDLHGEGLRDLARAAAGQRAVGFHIGNGGLRRDHRRTERQKAGQQKQQPFHVITSAQGNPAHPAAGEIPVSFF